MILPAAIRASVGKPLSPVACKSTAPVAKINTGSCIGSAISGTKIAPFLSVKVKLLAIADSASSSGEPTMMDKASTSASPVAMPNSTITSNDNNATTPALNSQCTISRASTHSVSGALATTICASVPLSNSPRNKSSTPITSAISAAIHTADGARRSSRFGSLPMASGNKVMMSKNSTKGNSHCTAPWRLICHSRCSMVINAWFIIRQTPPNPKCSWLRASPDG